jgi:hypothetical protein
VIWLTPSAAADPQRPVTNVPFRVSGLMVRAGMLIDGGDVVLIDHHTESSFRNLRGRGIVNHVYR